MIQFQSFVMPALLRIALAAVCGALVGWEREMRGRPAGLKTFAMVCLGSALVMITNEYIYRYLAGGSGDVARMAAQVISGIGFLGAGSIIVTQHNQVQGLTTAAELWVTAALGITIGAGFIFGGIAGVCIIYVIAISCRKIDDLILRKSRYMQIYLEGTDEGFLLDLLVLLNQREIRVCSLQRKEEGKWCSADTGADIVIDFGRRCSHAEFLTQVRQMEGVRYAEEI